MALDRDLPPLDIRRAADIAAQTPDNHWLVRDVWSRAAAGLLGGEPKIGKTWFGLDLAVSVASASPFLGRFEVDLPGTTLVYLAEDELPVVRERIDSICRSRRVSVDSLPLHVVTEPVLRLDLDRDQRRLAAALERLRPRFVLLDPLIRLHRLDENSASDISGLLGYFRELQRRYDCAVMITHHTSKKRRAHPGQRLRGSSDLHAFGASNAYLERGDDERLLLQLEHRAARSPAPVQLRLVADDPRSTHLEVVTCDAPLGGHGRLVDDVLQALAAATAPLSAAQLRDQLRVNNQKLHDVLHELEHRGLAARDPRGWRNSQPPPARSNGNSGSNTLFD